MREIRAILASKELIYDDFRFLLLARFSGLGGKLQAGEFMIPAGVLPGEVLRILASARAVEYRITIPEGLHSLEIANILEEGGWCDPRSFINLVNDQSLIKRLGFTGVESLEGYLFPDTYLLTKKDRGAEKIITILVDRFQEVWKQLTTELKEPVDRHRTVILASMVEKETGDSRERPHIAGVFQNRLLRGMRLQSDPTVSFGLKKFDVPLSREDLRTPTPYNTYTLSGLPSGPICNPGRAALAAVLHPMETKDLYFVAKNDGTHKFSQTLAEHNRAVRKYQRKKTGEKGK